MGASVSSSCRSFGPEEEEEEGEEEGEEEEEKEEGEEEEKEDGEQEQEVEQAKERENELATLGLTMVCLNTVILVTQMPYFLKFRAAACTSSPYRNIRMDAYSLQCIFAQSLIATDQLQQMYDTCFVQYAGDNDEQSFALRVNDALSNAMIYWRLLENTVKECESNVMARLFQKPKPWEIDLKNELSTEFFCLFFGRKEFEYHSCVRDLMKSMSEWILNAEELLREGYILQGKDEVWTRQEKDSDRIMMENDEDCIMLDDDNEEDWIL